MYRKYKAKKTVIDGVFVKAEDYGVEYAEAKRWQKMGMTK